jgi:hypothetical protein
MDLPSPKYGDTGLQKVFLAGGEALSRLRVDS